MSSLDGMKDDVVVKRIEKLKKENACKWIRAFDQHFNIGCVNKTKERANGNFKSCDDMSAKWEFVYCPYCGKKIEIIYPDPEG